MAHVGQPGYSRFVGHALRRLLHGAGLLPGAVDHPVGDDQRHSFSVGDDQRFSVPEPLSDGLIDAQPVSVAHSERLSSLHVQQLRAGFYSQRRR